MQEFLKDLLLAIITAAVPVATAYVIILLNRAGANLSAKTNDTKAQSYIREITAAVSAAVSATSQTYVDALKNAGQFNLEAQREAAKKALITCIASISPAAQKFAEEAYGDLTVYLTTLIEAEVRNQKFSVGIPVAALEGTVDPAAVAASTAAATAATIAQTAVQQLQAEPAMPDQQSISGEAAD